MHPISVALDTYLPREEIARSLVGALDLVRARFVQPLLAARGSDVRVWFELQPATHAPTDANDERAWLAAQALVESGGASYVAVESEDTDVFASSGYFHFGAQLAHELLRGSRHSITMHVHPTLFAGVPQFDFAHEVVAVAKTLASECRANSGYIACHHALSRAERPRPEDLEEESFRRLHGCYWGNFLSTAQLETLGGRFEVIETSPAHVVEDLSNGTHELVFLSVSGDPRDDHLEELLELERFLRPVLPFITTVV